MGEYLVRNINRRKEMKVILVIIALFSLVIGASINDMAVNILEQIYAGMFYIIAMIAFSTFALLFKDGGFNPKWKNWLRRECGLEDETSRNLDQSKSGRDGNTDGPDVIIVDLGENNNMR